MDKPKLSFLFVLAAALSLPACADTVKQRKVDSRGFVQTAAKKGGSGVKVAYRIENAGQPNAPVQVTLEFSGVSAPEGATASIAGEAPALVSAPASLALAAGQTRSVNVTLTAPNDGTFFINVTTVQSGRPSVVQVPVRIGAGGVKLQKQGTEQTTPGGERVISLPSK
jgi:hypothetical protein